MSAGAWLGGIRGSLGSGDRGRLHLVRGDLRVVGGDGAGDGDDPAAGDDRERLSAIVCAGGNRRVGDDRDRYSTSPGVDPVRDRGGAVGAAACFWPASCRACCRRRRSSPGSGTMRAGAISRWSRRCRIATGWRDGAGVAGAGGAGDRAGGHLRRDRHRDRGRGDGRRGRAADQPGFLSRVPLSRDAAGDRGCAAQRRHDHADRRDRAGVRPLDDGIGRAGASW